ncbi:MAG TPA: ClpXP protease specificity-enhancing factor SspB [Xanthobacteraceae bacterium]|nr:ClpXP protease specificity-enhancing factor SspB [Xanthobacteraceae bacterium]
MTVDYIRYDILTQDALRSVVRTVLVDVAAKGLPGEHHFFISFDTRAEGVGLSPRLKAEYPREMKIVLQHQFWDLIVSERGFEVGLAFGGVPERLAVPFAAITRFEDPCARFDIQFVRIDEIEELLDAEPEAAAPAPAEAPAPPAAKADAKPDGKAAAKADAKPQPTTGGEVVRLDRFRKK